MQSADIGNTDLLTATETARVLVVEDDRAVREAITRALDFEGYQVTTANDVAKATAIIRQRRDMPVLLPLNGKV